MHPRRSMTALIVLLVAVGAIWFYLPRADTEALTTPTSYVPDSPLQIGYASTTGLYRGSLFIENCNMVTSNMLPVGTTTVHYTLALKVERQASCASTGAVPHVFSAQKPIQGILEGVTVNGAIVPYTLVE